MVSSSASVVLDAPKTRMMNHLEVFERDWIWYGSLGEVNWGLRGEGEHGRSHVFS